MKQAAKRKVLPRLDLGHPMLRKKAKRVSLSYLQSVECQTFIRDLTYTMRRVGAVGLAAPQVGVPLRIAVLETRPTPWRKNLEQNGPRTIVNPKIISSSGKPVLDWEGCFSFLPMRGRVPRFPYVTVEYLDENGVKVVEEASGLWARIFQHEIDHLDGVVYVDRMTDMKSLMTQAEFMRRFRSGKKKHG